MTAAEYQALAAQTAASVANVEAITAAARTRGFDPDLPLPPLNIRPTQNLWEPAAVHYRDLDSECEGSSFCAARIHVEGCFATNPDYAQ